MTSFKEFSMKIKVKKGFKLNLEKKIFGKKTCPRRDSNPGPQGLQVTRLPPKIGIKMTISQPRDLLQ